MQCIELCVNSLNWAMLQCVQPWRTSFHIEYNVLTRDAYLFAKSWQSDAYQLIPGWQRREIQEYQFHRRSLILMDKNTNGSCHIHNNSHQKQHWHCMVKFIEACKSKSLLQVCHPRLKISVWRAITETERRGKTEQRTGEERWGVERRI